MNVSGDKVTGLLIEMSVEALRALPRIPWNEQVTVEAVAEGAVWTKMPANVGTYWRRITLSDGTVYSTRTQNVVGVPGRLYYADENWCFTFPITESNMVTWQGPLTALEIFAGQSRPIDGVGSCLVSDPRPSA